MTRRFACGASPERTLSGAAVVVLLLLSLLGSGCSLFRRPPPLEPTEIEPAEPAPEESATEAIEEVSQETVLAEELEADGLLALADAKLEEGDATAAAETYSRIVDDHPQSDEAPQALFQLAAMQLDPSTPIYDRARGIDTLERIGADHPASPWAPAAELVLELTRQNADLERTLRTLEAQLDELKKLDLSADPSDG